LRNDTEIMDAITYISKTRTLDETLLANAEAAFALLAADRGSGHDNSPFHLSVFDSGYECFKAALADSKAGLQRMRIFSAAVGSGKTTCGMCYIAGLIESAATFEAEYGHRPAALIVVEQKTKAEQTYKDMVSLLGTKRVAIYTSDHDEEHERDTQEQLELDVNRTVFTPSAWFAREDLARYEVAIVTANFFRKGGRRGEEGMRLAGYMADGRRRDFVLVDEQIEEISVFPVVCAEISAAHRRVQERAKLKHAHANAALAAITPLKEFAEDMDRKRTPLETLAANAQMEWFASEAATDFVEGMDATTTKVFEFARCYQTGFAFITRSKIAADRWETIYTGYRPDMECMPGTMILDASAAVDNVAQLSPWRVLPAA
jgi:DEAD/DEAH box helicase